MSEPSQDKDAAPAPSDTVPSDTASEANSELRASCKKAESVRHALSHKDIHYIHDLFTSFDKDNTGDICRAEVIKVFPKGDHDDPDQPYYVDTEHGRITLDQDHNKMIDWDEWLTYFAAVKHGKLKRDEKAWKDFMGYVELNAPISPRQKWHMMAIFQMYDKNNDQMLTHDEVNMLVASSGGKTKRKFEANECKLSQYYETESEVGVHRLSLGGLLDWTTERRTNRGFWDIESLIDELWGYKVSALDEKELEMIQKIFNKLCAPSHEHTNQNQRHPTDKPQPPTVSLLLLAIGPLEAYHEPAAMKQYTKAQLLQRASYIKLHDGRKLLAETIARWDRIEIVPAGGLSADPKGEDRGCCAAPSCSVQ